MNKFIGIIAREEQDKNDYEYYGLNKELVSVINNYNYQPLCIIVDFNEEPDKEFIKVKDLIDRCDGFILQGGTNYYEIDILIAKYLYESNIPTFGICLGMQIMGSSFEGRLIETSNNNHYSKEIYVHSIEIEANTKLSNILEARKIMVNSRHLEYITNTILKVSAYSEDGIIESIEDNDKTFFIGVQWHPESNINDPYNRKLFDAYFNSLC